jgi:hypothetical protein
MKTKIPIASLGIGLQRKKALLKNEIMLLKELLRRELAK